MKKLALIGIGKMGLSHLAIANMTPDIEVTAICDVSGIILSFLSKNSGVKTYKDYTKMIQECDLDAVMICVPNAMHFDVAAFCIENNLHVFVEKPFTMSLKQSEELCRLAQEHNIKGQVGYVNRFNPVFRKVKQLLDQKIIGEVVCYNNKMIGGVILKENINGWRNDYSKGGGCLYDYGPHCFDLSTYFFGNKVKVSSAFLSRIYSTRVDDVVTASFLHNGKIPGFNYINWSDSSVRKATNSIEIIGTKGKISANKQEMNIYLCEAIPSLNLQEGWNQYYVTDENTDVPYYLRGEDFSNQLLSFSELINSKIEKSISSFEDAKATDMLIENIYKYQEI